MQMEVLDFTRNIKKYADERLFFVYGTESYLIDTACQLIYENCGLELPEFNYTKLEDGAASSQIIENAGKAPVFAEKTLLHIKNSELFEGKAAEQKALIDFLDEIPETSIVIFSFWGSDDAKLIERSSIPLKKLDKRKALYKALCEKAFIVAANPLPPQTLRAWVLSTAKKKGLKLDPRDADFLSYICAPDMYSIMNELDKLKALGKEAPDAEDISSIASHTTEYSVFMFHDLMMKKDYNAAFELLHTIETEEKNFVGLVASLASKFRLMYMAKSSLSLGYSQAEAARQITEKTGTKPYPAKLAAQECKSFSLEALRRSFRLLLDYDITQKSSTSPEDFRIFALKLYSGL